MYLGIEKSIEEVKNEIITLTGLHPSKIRNIYPFGSRVYGNFTLNSDLDCVVIACSMNLNVEIHEGLYNIHITTPDAFKEQLDAHDIRNIECIYAPRNITIASQIDYLKDFRIYTPQLKKMIITQSAGAWTRARKRLEQGNIIGGAKSLYHTFRILKFGLQLMEYRKIVDFTAGNDIWEEVKNFEGLEWQEYQDKWLEYKKTLQKQMRRA